MLPHIADATHIADKLANKYLAKNFRYLTIDFSLLLRCIRRTTKQSLEELSTTVKIKTL